MIGLLKHFYILYSKMKIGLRKGKKLQIMHEPAFAQERTSPVRGPVKF